METVPDVTPKRDRRSAICETALDLAATGGNRAVTHTAIDRALDLPKGSTSYYFRTRVALLAAAVAHLTLISRDSFAGTASGGDAPAVVVAGYLHDLTTRRIRDVRARFALAPDAAALGSSSALRDCLFSPVAARDLFAERGAADPAGSAADLVVYCEGVAAVALFSGSATGRRELSESVGRCFPDLVQ
ncbi:TetR/AcrR family transcriptional regulator [Gordonia neofelifaecis]|uniref:Regulatory protein TetR n=1 Tax=Gordonia neofelifaecis NRRL B-59395 TaxID=644548 RepID=F1YMR6_9ACTN|nr:hypothetical protein [Gordonia neofelifaecis]EGD54001.1 regulatory protein TetR [Gordonia neofelifaecis NRRL B-59395]